MRIERSDFSAYEYTGKLLNDRLATIFERRLQGETLPDTANDLGISLSSVKDAWRRINAKAERETGMKPRDFQDTIKAFIQLGEITYNPPVREI